MEQIRKLKIDPEFRDKIPPLTDDEFRQLEENILKDGEVYEPIVTWNGTIVDGHNRWKIIQANPTIPYRVKEIDFPDKWAAFDWMYTKQLGRRNLTEPQRTYLIGKMYETRKHMVGNPNERGEDGKFQRRQNDANGEPKRVREQIAEELGIGFRTVERSEKYAHGIDAIKNVNKDAADAILTGKVSAQKKYIADVGKATPEIVERTARAIKENKVLPPIPEEPNPATVQPQQKRTPIPRNKDDRESLADIGTIVATMTDVNREIEHTVDDLLEDIKVNGRTYINMLRRTIEMKKAWIATDSERASVRMAIDNIVNKIKEVRLSI